VTDHVPDSPAAEARRKSPLRRAVSWLIVAVFVGFLVYAVAQRWNEVRDGIGQLSAPAVALATVTMFAGIYASFLCWRAILADFGSSVPLAGGMRIFFVGQAGKYLPGKLWPILTQARIGRDYDVPARASSAAAAIFMLMVLGTGLLIGAAGLPVLGAGALGDYWWVLLALPVAAVVLWPPVLNRLIGTALRVAKREQMPAPLTFAGVARAAGWSLVMWALYGVHMWALLRDLGVGGGDLVLVATAVFAASWSIGFLLLVAPAGAGPREVAMLALLGAAGITGGAATVATLVSRLIMTIGDLGWMGIALVVERMRRRSAKEEVAVP
jgi:glycosyltransferase 2 family protein